MARYIRTIMGSIYKVDNNKYGVIEENGIFKKYCENMGHSWYSELVATKQSENLEELCDCFVTEGNRHIVWDKQQNKGITFEQVKESFPSYHFKIYGAIWTSKGLIYVAKMNSEGKLVLI